MFIDRILARFKIQTKVLFFILPFVVSISAVGITGLYASGLLQGRMEISNSVLKTLSGFKDVYAQMNNFLQQTTDESRRMLKDAIVTQKEVLAETAAQVAGGNGEDELAAAIAATSDIETRIDGLWTLHEGEQKLRAETRADLERLAAEQAKINEEANRLQYAVRKDENAAKTMLRNAEKLMRASRFYAEFATEVSGAITVEEKLKVAEGHFPAIGRTQRDIFVLLPKGENSLAETVNSASGAIGALIKTPPGPETLAGLSKYVDRFRTASFRLEAASVGKMREATQIFSELDGKIAGTESVLTATRRLSTSLTDIQIAAAAFLGTTSEESRKKLLDRFLAVQSNLTTLRGIASGMSFFDQAAGALLPIIDGMKKDGLALVEITDKRTVEFGTTARMPADATSAPSLASEPSAPRVTTARRAPRARNSPVSLSALVSSSPADPKAIERPSTSRSAAAALTETSWETLTPAADSARRNRPPSSSQPICTWSMVFSSSISPASGRYPAQAPKSSWTKMRSPAGVTSISV